MRISNERARAREIRRRRGWRKRRKSGGKPSAGVTFGEPAKRKRDAPSLHPRVRTRVQNARLAYDQPPRIPLRAYTRALPCLYRVKELVKEREEDRRRDGWTRREGEDKVAREKERDGKVVCLAG